MSKLADHERDDEEEWQERQPHGDRAVAVAHDREGALDATRDARGEADRGAGGDERPREGQAHREDRERDRPAAPVARRHQAHGELRMGERGAERVEVHGGLLPFHHRRDAAAAHRGRPGSATCPAADPPGFGRANGRCLTPVFHTLSDARKPCVRSGSGRDQNRGVEKL